MKPLCYHLILSVVGRRVLAPTVAARRLLVTTVAAIGVQYQVFLFHAPDTHIHLAAACERFEAGRLAQRLETSLRILLALPPFRPAEIIEVQTQSHLRSLPGYFLDQARHHGIQDDACHEGSVGPDLIGLRCIAPHALPVLRSLLPRLSREEVLKHMGLEGLAPGSSPHLLADAAAASLALPRLEGKGRRVMVARVAAIAVGRELGLRTDRIGERLELSTRTVQRLARETPDPAVERAIRFQIGLRERAAVAARG